VDGTEVAKIVWALVILAGVIVVCVSAFQKRGSSRYTPGAGAYGAVYDLLNEDKRKAVEIIVEEKAEARDPERATDKI
jgi:hypothetical protein